MRDIGYLLPKVFQISSARGLAGAGSTLDEMQFIFSFFRDILPEGALLTADPGDIFMAGGKDSPDFQLSAPIAIDVWYLWGTTNILPTPKAEAETYVSERLAFLTDKLGGMKPLRTIVKRSDLVQYEEAWDTEGYFENTGPYYIKQMRFETRALNESFETDSVHKPQGLLYAYLAFPVGQLGVMRVLSVFGEVMLEAEGFAMTATESPQAGGEFSPPRGKTGDDCVGTHLYEKAWVKMDAARVEYPAGPYLDSVLPHMWMRYWVLPDDKFPTPGEFVGLLCRPMSVPPHAWWFQETSPLLMSGNWFETRHYSSGVVSEIVEEADLEDEDEIGRRYKIKVHGLGIWVKPSDWFEYSVGDRVALIKKDMIGSLYTVFTWKNLSERDDEEELYTDIIMVPVSFYEGS